MARLSNMVFTSNPHYSAPRGNWREHIFSRMETMGVIGGYCTCHRNCGRMFGTLTAQGKRTVSAAGSTASTASQVADESRCEVT
jgi:hypothetical protein